MLATAKRRKVSVPKSSGRQRTYRVLQVLVDIGSLRSVRGSLLNFARLSTQNTDPRPVIASIQILGIQ